MVNPKDVEESFIRASGPGGQNVNKVATCVRLLHLPTKIMIKCAQYRTQAQNRELAWRLLERALLERQRDAAARELAAREKVRRQKRRRTKLGKERMLENKKIHARIKSQRRKGSWDD